MSLPTWEERCLSSDEIRHYREHATVRLKALQADAKAPSWIRPDADSSWLENRSEQCHSFDTNGFLVVSDFCDSQEVQALKQQMADLAEHRWHPEVEVESFGTSAEANTNRGDYFLDSSNQVHYFAEPTALEGKRLKPQFETNKLGALNKAGHGMHTIPGSFRDYTLSKKMRDLVTDLGWKDPVVPQSMYIFKQPRVGGTVNSHQDSTFLYTTPKQSCLGLWLALDDATLHNGCLWVRPGSHREPVRRQFIRNPDYFENNNLEAAKLIFRTHDDSSPSSSWEGGLPESLIDQGFVPVEVKAGDLVTFCGTLDHLSLPNFSDLPRHTFQLHLVEGPQEGVQWSPENWLQYPEGVPFLRLIEI